MRSALRPKRGSSPALSFINVTDWARPAFTPAQTVPFTTKAGLDAAIAGLQAGDLVQYTGTGVLNITSSSNYAYTIANKNLVSPGAVIDFGTSKSIWDASHVSANYVKIAYTGTANQAAFLMNNCSNLNLFGGEFTSGTLGGKAIQIYGPTHDVLWYDAYMNITGADGLHVNANLTGGGASNIHNFTFRGEANRFCMNPARDPHLDKGTGIHGAILHGNNGTFNDSTICIYAHDPLRPGEVSNGITYPEGGGGSAIEPGLDAGTCDNLTLYVRAENLLMVPDGSNPGSTQTQTGGNGLDFFGATLLNGCVVGWMEATNCTGTVLHCATGNWHTGSPPVTVQHGRHTNVNQSTINGNGAPNNVPYPTGFGVVYNDCT